MLIEKTIDLDIDTDDIIEEGNLTSSSEPSEVEEAVRDYVFGLEDDVYYLITEYDITTICNAICDEIYPKKSKEE